MSMTHAYGSIILINSGLQSINGVINGDIVDNIATQPHSNPVAINLFGDMNIIVARSISIRSNGTPYTMRYKHPCSYNGSEDCNYWGPWITITTSLKVQDSIAFVDVEFGGADNSGPLYIEIEA